MTRGSDRALEKKDAALHSVNSFERSRRKCTGSVSLKGRRPESLRSLHQAQHPMQSPTADCEHLVSPRRLALDDRARHISGLTTSVCCTPF